MTATVTESAARGDTPRPATMHWLLEGACRAEDPELFFPDGHGAEAHKAIEAAKAVCARCPVRETCREWSISTRQKAGVWGGLSELERRSFYNLSTESQFAQCVARQAYIEGRIAAGVSQRVLASEMRVARKALQSALAYFRMERDQLDDAAGVAA